MRNTPQSSYLLKLVSWTLGNLVESPLTVCDLSSPLTVHIVQGRDGLQTLPNVGWKLTRKREFCPLSCINLHFPKVKIYIFLSKNFFYKYDCFWSFKMCEGLIQNMVAIRMLMSHTQWKLTLKYTSSSVV